jgi:hypothetical protein
MNQVNISEIQSNFNFFVKTILVSQYRSKIFEICSTLEGFLTSVHILALFCIQITRHEHTQSLFCPASWRRGMNIHKVYSVLRPDDETSAYTKFILSCVLMTRHEHTQSLFCPASWWGMNVHKVYSVLRPDDETWAYRKLLLLLPFYHSDATS